MAFLRILAALLLLSLLTHPTISSSHKTISIGNNFDNQNDLPTLNAVLQWTYNPTQSTLSMAFTAQPPNPDGWVAWALNPHNMGMVGAQALIAFKPNSTSPVTVNTWDIISYSTMTMGPISYNVTGLAAEESNGTITIFATWALPIGQSMVNMTWQVGPVFDGKPGRHALDLPNLSSKMKLNLANGPTSRPTLAPTSRPAHKPTSGPALAPATAGPTGVPAPAPAPANSGAGKALLLGKSFGVSMLLVMGTLVVSLF